MKNSIDQAICKKCKLCIEVCPCNIIGINNNNVVDFISEKEHICIECGQCMSVCNSKAISVNDYLYEDNIYDLPENKVGHNEFVDFLANRRSVRNYKDRPVPDELINKILESVSFAPFGAAPEKMKITIVNNRTKIESALPHIAEFLDNIVKWIESPIALFMIKRKNKEETFNTLKNHIYPIAKSGNYKLENGDRITRGAPAIIILHAAKSAEAHTTNAFIYATYISLAAHALGLGASMIEIVPAAINKVNEVREIFKIPEQNEAIISVIVGYPKYKYKRAIKRTNHSVSWIE